MSSKDKDMTFLRLLSQVVTDEIPVIDMEDCVIGPVVGAGAAMTVYAGSCKINSARIPVAFKETRARIGVAASDRAISRALEDIRQEVRLMAHLRGCSNVVRIFGVTFRAIKPLLVVELAKSSLCFYLTNAADDGNPICWDEKVLLCDDIASGLLSLHRNGIVHGDIKCDNVLIFEDQNSPYGIVAKISDFGYSSTLTSIAAGKNPGGTPQFHAPEQIFVNLIETIGSQQESDIYSYGLSIWQIAQNGEAPFSYDEVQEIEQLKQEDGGVLDVLLKGLPHDCPDIFRTIISGTVQYTIAERTSLMEIRNLLRPLRESRPDDELNVYQDTKTDFKVIAKERRQDTENFKAIELIKLPLAVKKQIFHDYDRAANMGDPESAFLLAVCYGLGFGVEENKRKMLEWCIKAADRGSLDAMINLASQFELEEVPREPSVVFRWFLQAAKAGRRDAMSKVANCYMYGKGIEKSQEDSIYWSLSSNTNTSSTSGSILITETVLHRAARYGNVEAIRYQLQCQNVNVGTIDQEGRTPLHVAAEHGQVAAAEVLITEFGADINASDVYGCTPFFLAAGAGHLALVKMLFTIPGVDPNAININDEGKTLIHVSASHGYLEVVRFLAKECGLDPKATDNEDQTPLHRAAENGHVEVVRALTIEFGTDPNIPGLEKWTPLHAAAENGHVAVVEVLGSELKADVNSQNMYGETPLYCAAGNGHADVVKLLAGRFGASAIIKNRLNYTPLHFAASRGHEEVVALLVNKFKVDVNVSTIRGKTPLHEACENGHIGIVKSLIAAGANINRGDHDGRTPLYWAKWNHQENITNLLLSHGGAMQDQKRWGKPNRYWH